MRIPALEALFADVQRNMLAVEADAARADPIKHKLSPIFSGGPGADRYNYWQLKVGRRCVRYCTSIGRNVCGYYLGWREVETPAKRKARKPGDVVSHIKRDQWTASKRRKTICDRQLARFRAHKRRLAA